MKLSLIKIAESQGEIDEALGVPANILETAQKLFSFASQVINNNELKNIQNKKGFVFKETLTIADLNFNETLLHFVFRETNEKELIVFDEMGVGFEGKFDDKKLAWIRYNDLALHITTVFSIGSETTKEDLQQFFIDEKKTLIQSFAHELKHYYDQAKIKTVKLNDRSNYNANYKYTFNLKPVDDFLFMLYYTDALENLVRPTEIYAAIRQNSIMQKDFYNFLLNHSTYKTLKVIQNFSYNEFKQDLKDNYMDRVDEILKKYSKNNITDPDEKVDAIARLIYITVTNQKLANFKEKLILNNIFPKFSKYYKSQIDAFDKYKRKEAGFKSHNEYFMYNEKEFKFVADRMIKKISKLYALLDSDNKQEKMGAINEFKVDEQLLQRIKDKATEIGAKAGEVSREIAGKVGDKLKSYSQQGQNQQKKTENGRNVDETRANFIKIASDPTKKLGFGEATGQNESIVMDMAKMKAKTEILKKIGENDATFGSNIVDQAMFQLPNGNKQYFIVLELVPTQKI